MNPANCSGVCRLNVVDKSLYQEVSNLPGSVQEFANNNLANNVKINKAKNLIIIN